MRAKTRLMLFSAMFAALTAIGAFIRIPIPPYPIPMTLQTAFLFLSGLMLPPRAAFASQAAYVLLGLMGIPVFTNGGGIHYFLDPTFGYLLAFPFAAALMSMLSKRTLYVGRIALFSLLSLMLILAIQLMGVGYMALVSSAYINSPLELSRALYLILIFIPLDLVKLALASMLAIKLNKRLSLQVH